jgi:hypothetical protein
MRKDIRKLTIGDIPGADAVIKRISGLMLNTTVFNKLRDMALGLQRAHIAIEQFKDKLKKDDVFVIPFFYDLSLQELYGFFSDNKYSAVQLYDQYFQKRENLESLLNSWTKEPLYFPRIDILEACLWAHYEKKFELSIPVFLTQIDGILFEIFKSSNHHNALKSLKFKNEEVGEIFGQTKVIDLLLTKIFKTLCRSARFDNRNFPNRHLILHGLDLQFYQDPFASLKLVLVIDCLKTLTDKDQFDSNSVSV